MPVNVERNLALEANAVRVLRAALIEEGCDEDALTISIESETNLHENIAAVMEMITNDEALVEGLSVMLARLSERKVRLSERLDRRRSAIERAMSVAELHRLELPEATLSLRRVPPGLLILDETAMPDSYFKPSPPKLDRNALKEALKAGTMIDGARLDNGSTSLTIRRA